MQHLKASCVSPITDFHRADVARLSDHERRLRCKLASCYRLVDLMGWSNGVYNHISAKTREDGDKSHFLINPYPCDYSDITASSLVKVDLSGEIIDQGSTTLGINRAGYTLHSAVYERRKDINCIIHVHTPSVVAVSAMKCGLLPLSQDSLCCGGISYHDYSGIVVDPAEKESIQRSLGAENKLLVLRNHGVVACGETVEEAWYYLEYFMNAADQQVRAIGAGMENLILVSEDIQRKTYELGTLTGGGGVDMSSGEIQWKTGEIEFENNMRIMDRAGYKTGYDYKIPF